MISIQSFVYNPFQENTYVLSDHTGECLIVDAGCQDEGEQAQLTGFISDQGLKPVALVNTHCHVDHILGIAFLAEEYELPFFIHPEEKDMLKASVAQGEFFGIRVDAPPEPDGYLRDGERFSFGASSLEILHVPGHSKGSVALHSEEDRLLLAGDVLFQGSIGRTDLPGGDYEILIQGIQQKLLVLDEATRVYPGHGPSTTIGEERAGNPFLR